MGEITASLGIALIHSTPYQPEGRGNVSVVSHRPRGVCLPMAGTGIRDLESRLLEMDR